MLICIDGVDAAGKNTQAEMLRARLAPRSVVMSFPRYNTALGDVIKRHLTGAVRFDGWHEAGMLYSSPIKQWQRDSADPMVFQCMMTVDKYAAAADIEAHRREGTSVILDRWTPSALAYGVADGLDGEWLERIQARLPVPDVNLFVDVPEDEALRRRPQLRDRYEKDREKQQRVREEYARIWGTRHTRPGKWVVVDGVGTSSEVHERIWAAVQP